MKLTNKILHKLIRESFYDQMIDDMFPNDGKKEWDESLSNLEPIFVQIALDVIDSKKDMSREEAEQIIEETIQTRLDMWLEGEATIRQDLQTILDEEYDISKPSETDDELQEGFGEGTPPEGEWYKKQNIYLQNETTKTTNGTF